MSEHAVVIDDASGELLREWEFAEDSQDGLASIKRIDYGASGGKG